jgi:hypothetical protein
MIKFLQECNENLWFDNCIFYTISFDILGRISNRVIHDVWHINRGTYERTINALTIEREWNKIVTFSVFLIV